MGLENRARRPRQAATLVALGISLGCTGILAAPAAAPAACTAIAGSAVCDGDVATTEVGRTIVFPRGPAGARIGDYVIRPEGTLPQVLPKGSAAPGPRPLKRPDGLTDPRHGEDFGAFEFSAPAPSGLSSTGPLR